MALTTMMMIKNDKEAVDKEMTQGATAHLVSLPLLPIGHTLPPDRIQDISSTPTHCPLIVYKILSISTLHQPFTLDTSHCLL